MKYYLDYPETSPYNNSWAQGVEINSWAQGLGRTGFEGEQAVLRFVEDVKQFVNKINASFSRGCRLEVRHEEFSFDHLVEIHAVKCGGPSLVAKLYIKGMFKYITNKEGGNA